mgnify:CR=1 FL=1
MNIQEFDKAKRKPTPEEVHRIIDYKKNNPKLQDAKYGITKNLFFEKNKDGTFSVVDLPCKSPHCNQIILRSQERYDHVSKIAKENANYKTCGCYIFLSKNISSFEKLKERASYKDEEHKDGDNENNSERIVDGTSSELACEIFLNTKVTDMSNASGNSKEFAVPDFHDFDCGVKSSDDAYPILAYPNVKEPQVIVSYVKNKDALFGIFRIRGLVKKEDFIDEYKDVNCMLKDTLLATQHIGKNEKISYVIPHYKHLPIYGLEDLNCYAKPNTTLKDKPAINLVLPKTFNFNDIGDNFIKTLKQIRSKSNSTIIYVHLDSIGVSKIEDLSAKLYSLDNKSANLINLAIKFNLGIVFYSEYYLNWMYTNDLLGCLYNFFEDPYCSQFLDNSGQLHTFSKEKALNKIANFS